MKHSRCDYIWQNRRAIAKYRTAVSLHSHTQHSQESLEFIPRYSGRIPVLKQLVLGQQRRYLEVHGTHLDFRRAWWTPPLSPREAHDLERQQIEHQLGLDAIVSLSDHDDIEGPMHLRVLSEMRSVPISVEWTVPFGPSFFHVGVHNLPSRQAHAIMSVLAEFTGAPEESQLPAIFDFLTSFPSTLTVLNHPLWDEPGIGEPAHRALVTRFVSQHRRWLHAIELNGLRSWIENVAVTQFGAETGLPLISGGDRHGCEPNANLNLTNATSFDEFADEIRAGQSHVLYMNQYREPFKLRLMQGVLDVVRDYPDLAEGRRRWTDRVFFQRDDNSIRSLSALWTGDGPRIVGCFMSAVRLLESRRVRGALRVALGERQEGAT